MKQSDIDAVRTLADHMIRVDGDRDHMNTSDLLVEQTVCAAEALRALADAVEPDLMTEADHRAVLEMAGKRPVAFRVTTPEGVTYFTTDEAAANHAMENVQGAILQGLYLRDGA